MKTGKTGKLSDELRQAVATCGLSRYEIAKRTGLDEGLLSKFVHGKSWLSVESFDLLGECLGLRLVGPKVGGQKGKSGAKGS